MIKRDFYVWFPDEGETDADAQELLGARNHESAAEVAVELIRCGPEWQGDIDGEPVRICVEDQATGEVKTFDVHVSSAINYDAMEVGEDDDGHGDCEINSTAGPGPGVCL